MPPLPANFFGPAFKPAGRFDPNAFAAPVPGAAPFGARDFRVDQPQQMQSPFLQAFGMKLNPNLSAPEHNARLKAMMNSVMGGGRRVGGWQRQPLYGGGQVSTVPLEMMRQGAAMWGFDQNNIMQAQMANQRAAMEDVGMRMNNDLAHRQVGLQAGLQAQAGADQMQLGMMGLHGQAQLGLRQIGAQRGMARDANAMQERMAQAANLAAADIARINSGTQRDIAGMNRDVAREDNALRRAMGERAIGLQEFQAGMGSGIDPKQSHQLRQLERLLPYAGSDAQRAAMIGQMMGTAGANMPPSPTGPLDALPDEARTAVSQARSPQELAGILKRLGMYSPQAVQQMSDAMGLDAGGQWMGAIAPLAPFAVARQREAGQSWPGALWRATPAYALSRAFMGQ